MLSPDSRTIAFDLLRAPTGYRLDFAVLTAYTLDLEALLALPLSVVAHPDGDLEELLADPLRLHQAIREAGDRVHAFVDAKGISVPRRARSLYAMLESSVHTVRAPNRGAFHPKVWVARFKGEHEEAQDLMRVAVLSRNLTFDRSWDVALASEASPRNRRRVGASRPLGEFLSALPGLAASPVAPELARRVQALADEAARCDFPSPDGFRSRVEFHALGLSGSRAWRPPSSGYRTLAVAPFVNREGLDTVSRPGAGNRTLVSRQEELDKLPPDALADWDEVFVLLDDAEGEPQDGGADRDGPGPSAGARPSGLHAKMIAVEHWHDVTWTVGSANLTQAAFKGANVEVMASVTGRKGRKGGVTGHGIDRFLDGGFRRLCVPYRRTAPPPEDPGLTSARARLEAARKTLLEGDLRVTCVSAGDLWTLTVDGDATPPAGDVDVAAWPVSVAEDQARPLEDRPSWRLPIARLTAFIAFRLSVPVQGVDDVRLSLRLPAEGMPADRMHHVLRALLDSPEKLLRFLRALLGGLDAVPDPAQEGREGDDAGFRRIGPGGETLLEDLLRAASRDPDRLKPVRRLIRDLRKTEDGRRIAPDDLFGVWTAVEEALTREPRS